MLRGLAFRNARAHVGDYAAYLASSAVAVAVFFLYAALIASAGPMLQQQRLTNALLGCGIVVLLFSAVFTRWAHASFLRSRAQEHGLLKLVGMQNNQLLTIIATELALLAALAMAVGLAIGTLLEKLFFLIATRPLSLTSVPHLSISTTPYVETIAAFAALNLLLAVISAARIARKTVLDLLQDRRAQKQAPHTSPVRVLLACLLLACAWTVAATTSVAMLPAAVIIILATVIPGTWLLFSQLSVASLRWLQSRRRFYYRGTRMLVIGALLFRVREHARLMAVASLMSTVILVSLGSVFALYARAGVEVRQNRPWDVSYAVAANTPNRASLITRTLAEKGHGITSQCVTSGLALTAENGTPWFVLSRAAFIKLARALHQPTSASDLSQLASGQAVMDDPWAQGSPLARVGSVQLPTAGGPLQLAIRGEAALRVIDDLNVAPYYLIVNSTTWSALARATPASAHIRVYAWQIRGWKTSAPAVAAVKAVLAPLRDSNAASFTAAVDAWQEVVAVASHLLFVGLFIGLIFLLGLASMQYFRVLTDLRGDRRTFATLSRIGVADAMNRRIIAAQIATLLLAPCIVAELSGVFAFVMLGHALSTDVVVPALIVNAIYFTMMVLLCLVAMSGGWRASSGRRRVFT